MQHFPAHSIPFNTHEPSHVGYSYEVSSGTIAHHCPACNYMVQILLVIHTRSLSSIFAG